MIWNSQLSSQKVRPKCSGYVRRQPLVNGSKQDEKRSASCIKIPVGYWPVNLGPVLSDLVGLPVSIMIELLTNAGNDQYGCVSPETAQLLESTNPFRLSNENERYSLAEARARVVLSELENSTNLVFWNGNRFESTDHPPLPNDTGKVHADWVVTPFEKNILETKDRVRVGYLSLSSSLRTGISPNDLPAKLSSRPCAFNIWSLSCSSDSMNCRNAESQ